MLKNYSYSISKLLYTISLFVKSVFYEILSKSNELSND